MKKGTGIDKDLYEMSRKTMGELYQTNLDTLRELIDIEFNYVNLCQEYMNAQMDRISNAKGMSDVMAVESGLATEYANKFSETNRRLYETMSGVMEKQMKCLNLPADVENLIPDFQAYENMFNTPTKKSTPAKRKSG